MSITPVPISIRLVFTPIAVRRGKGEDSWRAKWWTRTNAPSMPISSAATASSTVCLSASAPLCVSPPPGCQAPNERKPIFLGFVMTWTTYLRTQAFRRSPAARRLRSPLRRTTMSDALSSLLSPSQLAALAEVGEERSAAAGELLYRVGDRTYPFIAILEGEVAIVDAAGNELVRHGPSSFLGELNLLSGQTVFVNALVTQPLRYIALERDGLRSLLNEDSLLSDLVLSTFIS